MPNRNKEQKYKATSTPQPTKKQQRISQKEAQQKKLLITIAAAIGGVIVIILLIGMIDAFFITPNKVIATVGEEEITVREYQNQARYLRWQLLQQYVQINQIMQLFGDYDGNQQNQMNQIGQLLESKEFLGTEVLNSMIEEKIILMETRRLGITVSDEDLEARLQQGFSYYPEGTPTPVEVPTTAPLPTLNATQLSLVTPTPTREPTQPAEDTEESIEEPLIEEDVAGEPELTPTPYTFELYEQNYADYLGDLSLAGVREPTFLEIQRGVILRERLYDFLTADIPATEEQVWARHILVANETDALSVVGQLRSDQMLFEDLALLLSQDTTSAERGGDLGWFGRGVMVPEFEEAAFSLEIGEISDPVQTTFGYHIIQVIARDEVPVTAQRLTQIKDEAFQNWLDNQRLILADQIIINTRLRDQMTPTEPSFSDARVYEALLGISPRDASATQAALDQEEAEYFESLEQQSQEE
jgi:parvulin-like peptidyl-prolyl isomerase